MNTEVSQEVQELHSADFEKGFNHASILADFSPDLLTEIEPKNNPSGEYFDGFFSAKELYNEQRKENSQELKAMEDLRNKSKERDRKSVV